MADELWVGTRKGLFALRPEASGSWRIARTAFLGVPVPMVLHDGRSGWRFAVLDQGHFGVKLHVSDDGGTSWREGAAPAYPGIHSIAVHPDDPDRVTIAISCGGVWVSKDDGAGSWREIEGVSPSSFGFTVAVHPADPDAAWFVPAVKDEERIPVDGKVVVTRTREGGATCEALRDALPQEHAYDLVFRHALDVAPDGETLAFGSTSGFLWLSDNQGDTWQALSEHLPPVYCVRFV